MKVLLINTLYHPIRYGGAERSVQYLAESLTDGGHDVVVATLGPNKADPVGVTGVITLSAHEMATGRVSPQHINPIKGRL